MTLISVHPERRRRALRAGFSRAAGSASVALVLTSLACASTPDGAGSLGAAGSSGQASAETAGSGPSTGGGGVPGGAEEPSAGHGGASGASSGGLGGTAAGGSAAAQAAAAGSGGSAPALTTKDFECTELIGLWVASQWWDSFEKGVDNAHWQFMFQHHGYLEQFADSASPYWANSVSSKCGAADATPDRVVFLPFSLTLNTLEQWQTNLTRVVATMKSKFPGVKRIELMTTLRSPGNMPCANDTDPNTVVAPYVDQAIQLVADASGGLVTVGPKIELMSCDWWAGGTDLTGAGNTGAGQLLAGYYQTR